MAPKDKNTITQKKWSHNSDEECIRESARTSEERFKNTLKAPSPMHEHSNITGHHTSVDNFSIVGRESQNLIRTIKEAIFSRVNDTSLNRNIGKYQHI